MNPRELLRIVERTWSELDTAIEGLDEAAMVEPGVVETWSVKDLLGHVVAWEQMAQSHLEQARQGTTLQTWAGLAVDAYNSAEAAKRSDWSLEQVRAEVAETRQQLRAALESIDDQTWTAEVTAGEWHGTVGELIGGDLNGDGPGTHAAEHAQHIREWCAQRSGT